jgi:hypothetical protein
MKNDQNDEKDCRCCGCHRHAVLKVRRQNRQLSFCQDGSDYISVDFQAEKSHIVALEPVFVEGLRTRFRQRLIPGLLMASKASIAKYRHCGHISVLDR